MKAFKEWLSDNLRYLMLFFALILGVIVIVMTVRLFQASQQSSSANQQPRDVIIIGTEGAVTTQKAAQEAQTEKQTEKKTEKQTEKQSDKKTTIGTEKETEKQSETTKANVVVVKPGTKTGETNAETTQTTQQETQAQTQAETQPQTQPQTEEIDTLRKYGSSTTLYAGVESNVRSGPGTEYNIIGGASQGEAVTITGETSGWYQVSYDGKTGYVAKNILVESYTPDYRSIVSACNLRSTPDYGDGNVIMELWAGATVEYLGIEEGWAKVSYEGTVGYVGTKFVG